MKLKHHSNDKLETALVRAAGLEERLTQPGVEEPGLLLDAFDALRTTLEELRVADEELRHQNEKLIESRVELDAERKRYEDLFELAPDCYLVTDRHGCILEANGEAANLLGWERRFLLNKLLVGRVALGHRKEFRAELNRICSFDSIRVQERLELQMLSRDGRVFDAEITISNSSNNAHGDIRLHWTIRDISERKQANAQVKELLRRIVSTQEDERRRIARDLHDHLGQQLTALRLCIATLRDRSTDEEGLDARITHIESLAVRLDQEVDFLASALRPTALDELGLADALQAFVTEWREQFNIECELHTAGLAGRLPSDVENNVYRIAQEALNNVAKHSEARRAAVILERRADTAVLIVEDFGKGFDPAEERGRKGLGLIGMQERTALVGGTLEIESAPGRGTTLFIRVPVHFS
jgi:PAS domain S-box-containing protein